MTQVSENMTERKIFMTDRYVDNYVEIGDLSEKSKKYWKNQKSYPHFETTDDIS